MTSAPLGSPTLDYSDLGPNPSTAQIDAVIHGLIDAHLNERIEEEAARREIASLLFMSGIHREEAIKRTEIPMQARIELADQLCILITQNVMSQEGKRSDFSFSTGRAASPCGWARQLLRSAIPSELRRIRRSTTRNGQAYDSASPEFATIAFAQSRTGRTPSLIVFDSHTAHVDGEMRELIESFTEQARGARGSDKVRLAVDHICVGLGINPALRPEEMTERDDLLVRLTADETLAQRSLSAFLNLLDGEPVPSTIDDSLLALWDDQTEDSAMEIISRGAQVAHTLALAAVSPLPRPSKKAIARLKTAFFEAGRAIPHVRDREWRDLSAALVDSYVAAQFEPLSMYTNAPAAAKNAALQGHLIDRARFEDLLNRTANHQRRPYGRTRIEVLRRLDAIARAAFEGEPQPLAAAIDVLAYSGKAHDIEAAKRSSSTKAPSTPAERPAKQGGFRPAAVPTVTAEETAAAMSPLVPPALVTSRKSHPTDMHHRTEGAA